jgi:hypothetical protein
MVNIYNINDTGKQFLARAWQLAEYPEVLDLIDSYPESQRLQLHWLLVVAAHGGDDIEDVSEASRLLKQFQL